MIDNIICFRIVIAICVLVNIHSDVMFSQVSSTKCRGHSGRVVTLSLPTKCQSLTISMQESCDTMLQSDWLPP